MTSPVASPGRLPAALSLALAVALHAGGADAQMRRSGGDGTIYISAYDGSIRIIDEATLEEVDRIETAVQIPDDIQLSHDGTLLYVEDAEGDRIEVVDLARRRTVGTHSLSRGASTVRINGFTPSPDDSYAIMFVREYLKLSDRYEIGDPVMLKYDLVNGAVGDTLDFPDGEVQSASIIFAPDGQHVYYDAGDLIVLETGSFTEVDRWEITDAWEPGLGRLSFGFPDNPYDEEGIYTGLFRTTDPVQNRELMGIARVDLEGREVDFYTLGPSESVEFRMAPGGAKAYGLSEQIGRYEFLTFDLVNRRLERRTQFQGRPRMSLGVSTNGELLYIYTAGNTIDIYDAGTNEHLRQVQLDADMNSFLLVPQGSPAGDL